MQNPSKLSAVSLARPPAFSGLQGWADLPDGLLHSIVARLASVRDILGFAATCPSWRAAFSYPSKSTFRTKCPPLLIQPNVRVQGPLLPSTNGCRDMYTCKVIDPANLKVALHCQIPQETLEKMTCIGSSYGNLIYYRNRYCRMVDVFTGVEVSAPRLPPIAKGPKFWLYGILTAPLASHKSHLLVSTKFYLFDWPIGSNSWSQVQLPYMLKTDQIVEFNGQFILSNGNGRFYSVQLAPQLGLQEITTDKQGWSQEPRDMTEVLVCGDMLIVLIPLAYELYRLDLSTKPTTVMTLEKLDDWALFIQAEEKGTPLSCMSPEQWGGRSNSWYYADDGSLPWTRPWTLDGPFHEPDPVQDAPPVDPDVGSQDGWGAWSNTSHSAVLDSWYLHEPDHVSEPVQETPSGEPVPDAWGASAVSFAALEPWDPHEPDHVSGPVQDTQSDETGVDGWGGSADNFAYWHSHEKEGLPIWLYPSMFYYDVR
ncbi:hypothetical protein VPH35_114115 [Triticum aestivum]